MAKRYRQLRVKDLPKIPTLRREWDSNLRPSGRKTPNLPLSHHTPQLACRIMHCLSQFSLCPLIGHSPLKLRSLCRLETHSKLLSLVVDIRSIRKATRVPRGYIVFIRAEAFLPRPSNG